DRERLSGFAPLVLLAVAMAAAAALLLHYGSGLTFFQDSWEFLMHRRHLSVDAVLDPHNEHIVLLPVLINQALLQTFGMSSMTPELVVLVALLMGAAALVFVYVRRRLGSWPALFATALLLFLGPAWQDFLWPFQIGFAGSALTGMAMLLALEEEDRRWDLAACAFLALSIAFSSLGLPFAVAGAVQLLQQRRQGGLRRAWIVGVPLLFYAGWYAGWGHTAENHLTGHNVLHSPSYVWEGLSASLDAVLALGTIANEVVGRSKWGAPLLIVLLVLVAYRGFRRRGFYPGLWPVLAATATFWFLAAFNTMPGREAYSSRYLYVGGLFAILLAANLLQGIRLDRRILLAAGALTTVVVGFNLVPLREGRDFFRDQTVLTRADLGALEIAERTVEPSFVFTPEIDGTVFLNEIEAGNYLQAVREHGSPAYNPAQLASAPEEGRLHADLVLANALPLGIEPESDLAPPPGARCRRIPAGSSRPIPLHPGTATVQFAAGGPGAVRLRRFAVGEYPLVTEDLAAGTTTALYIPRDRSRRPWRLQVEAPGGATVCN
ncbi:MAG TPA: hypothetical protein VFJ65_05350, partial [Solirubrobacterales bacterium]|nr:hypothetical protein [Solirubrobacterales bacterium]